MKKETERWKDGKGEKRGLSTYTLIYIRNFIECIMLYLTQIEVVSIERVRERERLSQRFSFNLISRSATTLQ